MKIFYSILLSLSLVLNIGQGLQNAYDYANNWANDMGARLKKTVNNLIDWTNDNLIEPVVPKINVVSSPAANYYTTNTNSTTNNNYNYDNDTYTLTTNYYYTGDTVYQSYDMTTNQYYQYTYDTTNNYAYNTQYFYEDTNNYYTSYYEYTNVTIVEMPKTNPNHISVYKYYYQTSNGNNSYNLTPSDLYGVYNSNQIYNYSVSTDSSILGLWHFEGNYVNEVPNSPVTLYYDGQTFVDSKFGTGLQLNGTVDMSVTGELPNQYTVRFWFYNALNNGNYNGLPVNAWTCCDYQYDNGTVTLWFNGIKGTRGTGHGAMNFVNGQSQFGKSSTTVNVQPPSKQDSLEFRDSWSNYNYYSAHIYSKDYPSTYSVGGGTSGFHSYPSFSTSQIGFFGTGNNVSGCRFYSNNTYSIQYNSSSYFSKFYYSVTQNKKTTTISEFASRYNNSSYYDYVADSASLAATGASDYSSHYVHVYEYYSPRISGSPSVSSGNYFDFTNCIFDEMVIYDGLLWDSLETTHSVPTDPFEYGFIWVAPVGQFTIGDIAIKSNIEVNRFRVGGGIFNPPQRNDLYLKLNANFFLTDAMIYDGSTWIHVDIGIWNGTSWVSGYNYDFKNGFMYPPNNNTVDDTPSTPSDNPVADGSIGQDALGVLAFLGEFFYKTGTFIQEVPLIPDFIKSFIGGSLILVAGLLGYKARK